MLEILERRNHELLRDLRALLDLIGEKQIPHDLQPYKTRLIQICTDCVVSVERNLNRLKRGRELVLEDVLSDTQQITQLVHLLSSQFANPILRASPSDRLCLSTLGWLHAEHPETRVYPPVFSDGNCAIWPFLGITPIYFFPAIEQRSLLYQPLLFHEFGHLLYACYKQEMDDLVADFQHEVEDLLTPASQRNDRHSDVLMAHRQAIADTWYLWTQEIFCDAVGFAIGGPSFLRAFSGFLSANDRGDFYRQPEDLKGSKHPVTWLRVSFLAECARAGGDLDLADSVIREWSAIARIMQVDEDYHGFYDECLSGAVTRVIGDMLVEASPRNCSREEADGNRWSPGVDSPVRLFNWAWQMYVSHPKDYLQWEAEQIELLLQLGYSTSCRDSSSSA
jgi:hypothetical protein